MAVKFYANMASQAYYQAQDAEHAMNTIDARYPFFGQAATATAAQYSDIAQLLNTIHKEVYKDHSFPDDLFRDLDDLSERLRVANLGMYSSFNNARLVCNAYEASFTAIRCRAAFDAAAYITRTAQHLPVPDDLWYPSQDLMKMMAIDNQGCRIRDVDVTGRLYQVPSETHSTATRSTVYSRAPSYAHLERYVARAPQRPAPCQGRGT